MTDFTKTLADVLTSEGHQTTPFYGEELEAPELQELKRGPVRVIQAESDPESDHSLATYGHIIAINAMLTVFAATAKAAVDAVVSAIMVAYKTNENLLNPPAASPFYVGGKLFWFFRPVGGVIGTASRVGQIFRTEQLIRIEMQGD